MATKTKERIPTLYCYVDAATRRYAMTYGKRKRGSTSAYVKHLIQADRKRNLAARRAA